MRGHGAQRGKQYAVRSAAAVAGVAVAVAIVAGCASRSGLATRDDKSAGGAIQFAAAKVVSARSVHVHATIAGGFDATIDGSIVFAPALQADLTLKAAGSTSAGANADIANAAGLLPTHVIYDGTTIYFPIKPSDNVTSKDKPKAAWFGLNADKTVAKDSPELALLRTDPAALVKELLAKGTFAQAGSETVDGVATTRFGMDVAGDTPGHVDVWLDEAGLPVEIAGGRRTPGTRTRTRTRASRKRAGSRCTSASGDIRSRSPLPGRRGDRRGRPGFVRGAGPAVHHLRQSAERIRPGKSRRDHSARNHRGVDPRCGVRSEADRVHPGPGQRDAVSAGLADHHLPHAVVGHGAADRPLTR
ncbi:hypothetical protein ACFQ9X_42890 [Catenulispora yoronensis]